ncbi:MAG TPA: rhomboid family intramembrane serine protease [Abditibacteriaceae bacterium]|jgi:rhomboid protease GluP
MNSEPIPDDDFRVPEPYAPPRFTPFAVYALMAANILLFVISAMRGGVLDTDSEVLFDMGMLFAPAVWEGQTWRLVTSTFLHAGVMHIAFNMWALHNLGVELERIYGPRNFLWLYFGAGWTASLASLMFTGASVGASGAVFGLAGAWLAIAFRRRDYFKAFGAQVLNIVVINLVIGYSFGAYIDNSAHIGGLIGGLAIAWWLTNALVDFRPTRARWTATVGFTVLLLALYPLALAFSKSHLANKFPTQ